jgi:hypothetical protein
MITRNEMQSCRDMFAEAHRLHDSQANGNVILASILAGGLLLMAAAGSIAGLEPNVHASKGSGFSEISAAERVGTGDISAFVLMSTAPHQLPVRPQDEPAF